MSHEQDLHVQGDGGARERRSARGEDGHRSLLGGSAEQFLLGMVDEQMLSVADLQRLAKKV